MELTLPRRADADEAVWLQVRAGALPPGAEISVGTADGELLGTVSPFGVQQGRDAGTYTIPVPEDAIEDGRVQLHLEVQERGGTVRPPLPGEVENLSLIFVPVTR